MTDGFRFTPADVTVKRGEAVKFIVANGGTVLHEMVLGATEELKAHAELMKNEAPLEHVGLDRARRGRP
jgi:uncharacterized cupredoxin-like copper-binding protein